MDLSEWIRVDLDELTDLLREIDPLEAETLGRLVLEAKRIYVAGQGRSGLVMRMFAMRLMQLDLTAFVVGDVTTPAIGAGDLLVVGSGSGETGGAVLAARRAGEVGARVAALTARPDSTLGRLAFHVVTIPGSGPKLEGSQPSRTPMGSVLEQALMVVTDCVHAWLVDRLGMDDAKMMARHANLE